MNKKIVLTLSALVISLVTVSAQKRVVVTQSDLDEISYCYEILCKEFTYKKMIEVSKLEYRECKRNGLLDEARNHKVNLENARAALKSLRENERKGREARYDNVLYKIYVFDGIDCRNFNPNESHSVVLLNNGASEYKSSLKITLSDASEFLPANHRAE